MLNKGLCFNMFDMVEPDIFVIYMVYKNMRKKSVRKIFCGYYLFVLIFGDLPVSVV